MHDERFNHKNFANLPVAFLFDCLSEAVEKKCQDINSLNYSSSWVVYFVHSFMGGKSDLKNTDFLPFATNKEKTIKDSLKPSTIRVLYRLWKEEKIPMKIINALNQNNIMLHSLVPEQ